MIYNFINSARSKAVRRLYAAAAMACLPLLLAVSLIVGSALFVADFIRDLYFVVRHDVPRVVGDLAYAIKTGKTI